MLKNIFSTLFQYLISTS